MADEDGGQGPARVLQAPRRLEETVGHATIQDEEADSGRSTATAPTMPQLAAISIV
jgi:hypothetical protein